MRGGAGGLKNSLVLGGGRKSVLGPVVGLSQLWNCAGSWTEVQLDWSLWT